jgi:3-oxoacyl-[acyl-carrier-protein] synthase-1
MTASTLQLGGSHGPAIVVTATSAVNGLAFDSHQTWAFWRADGSALVETPFRLRTGERATMAVVRSLDPRLHGWPRLAILVEAALMHLRAPLSRTRITSRVGIWLAVSEHLAEASDPYFGPMRRRLERRIADWLASGGLPIAVSTVPRGHAGFAHALQQAVGELDQGSVDLAIVGGADSYYDPLRFDLLEEQERIFDQSRTDAFIPGEGASFCVLARRAFARQAGLPALAALETVVTDEEPAPMLSDLPCTAVGLTRVMRGVTDRLRAERRRLDWMIGDLTNESYRARELMLALPRALAPGGLDTAGATYQPIAAEAFRGDHVPEGFGDLGAATMPTAVTLATQAFLRGDPRASTCMIVASSVGPDRGALLLRAEA